MTIENLTNPGVDPVDGDRIRITHASGAIEVKEYHAPVDPSPAPTVYKILTKQEALDLIIEYGQMGQAAELAFMRDPNLELFWLKWDRAVPYADINRSSPKVPLFLGAVVATGHITQAQADAIMSNWPTE